MRCITCPNAIHILALALDLGAFPAGLLAWRLPPKQAVMDTVSGADAAREVHKDKDRKKKSKSKDKDKAKKQKKKKRRHDSSSGEVCQVRLQIPS